MKVLRKILKHKFIIGALFMVVSITSLVAVLIPVLSADIRGDNTQVNTADKDKELEEGDASDPTIEVITPSHDYTTINASIATGAKIFAEVTTARDLKNNLKVMGTFVSGGSSVIVPLKQNEYSIQVAIESYVLDLFEDDIILNEMPDASQSINIIVKVRKTGGDLESKVSIPFSYVAEATEYEAFKNVTSITVDSISSLTNDYDKESLKEILNVKDQDGNIISNKELYKVTKLEPLTPGSSANFTVSYILGDGITASAKINNVSQAELIAADFGVNPDYRLDGMYYKKRSTTVGEENKWFSAFVTQANGIAGSTMQDIYGDGLKITVYYQHSSRILSFDTIGENSATADTNEYVIFNNKTFVENNNDITAMVYNRINGNSVTASISINFELAKIVEIKATGFNEGASGLTSSGVANASHFTKAGSNETYVITRANTGVWNETSYLSSSQIKVSGTLNPTADIITQTSTMTDEQLASFYYDKEVTIIYSADETITTKYPVKVKFLKPTSWNSVGIVNNMFPEQTMRMPFNYGDLFVNMKWNNQSRQVPLTDFLDTDGNSKHIKIILYKNVDGTDVFKECIGETPIITKEVQSILVLFRYNISDEAWSGEGAFAAVPELAIKKYVVTLPSFDTRSISFSSNAIKTISFDNSIEEEILKGMTLNVSDNPDFSGTSTFAEFNASNLSKVEDIKFLAGGKKYYIELKISDALKDEVEWASGEGVTGISIRYTVEISKGPINPVVVSYNKGEWMYGESPEIPIIVGTRVDGSTVNVLYGNQESDISSNVLYAKYVIYYYRKTSTGFEEVDLSTDKLTVGEYYVQIYIPDTTNYLEAYSTPGPGYGCPTITITQAPLSPNDLLPNISFDGISRDGTDFVTGITGIKFGDSDVVIANSLTSLNSGIPLVGNKALHAGKYSVKLAIADAHKNNYAWAEGVEVNADNTVTKEFEILKRNLGYDITNENSLGFIYGADNLPNPKFGYSDNYNVTLSPNLNPTKPSYFFADEGMIQYFNSSNEEVLAIDFKKWPAGTYTIKRELSVAVGHLASDYTLPTASATFIVEQKEIDRIVDANDSHTYDGDLWQYAVLNWNSDLDYSGDPILTGTLKGTPFKNDGSLDTESSMNLADYNTSFESSTGIIRVLHAGVYLFTITLNPNYKWKQSVSEEVTSDTPIITLTMNQKALKGSLAPSDQDDYTWDDTIFTFNPDSTTGQQTPVISMRGIALIDHITLSYTLHYSDGTLITDENKNQMTANDYYYLLTGWTGNSNEENYNLANNYKFPDDKIIIRFTVASAGLKDVEFTSSLQAEYKGTAFDFTEFITNLAEFTYGTKNSKILYYVFSDSLNHENSELLDGQMAPLLTDTGKYHIYIYPNTNFDWENADIMSPFGSSAPSSLQDKKGFKATFTITPKAIVEEDVLWGTTSFIYNGKKQTSTPSIDATKLLSVSDKMDVKLNAVSIVSNTSDGTTAGIYTAKLNGFADTSTRAFNYTIENFTRTITITPYELEAPTMTKKSGVFTGDSQTLEVTLPKASTVVGFDPENLIVGEVLGGYDSIGATAHGASYSNGVFTYVNSGKYSITFTLTDKQNYKWKADSTEIVVQDIDIERMKITAPVLGDSRTIEFDGSEKRPIFNADSYIIINGTKYSLNPDGSGVDVLGHQITWSIQFADFEKGKGFTYITTSISPVNYGIYYLEFNILDDSNQTHLNYEWIRNDADTDKLQFLTESGWGEVERSAANGTALFLAFMITRKVFQPTLEVLNDGKYIFGDNGVEALFTQNIDLGNKNNFIHLADSSDATTVLESNPIVTYTMYKINTLDNQFNIDDATEVTDLVNGLPWNKGYYGIRILIDFPESYQFQQIPLALAFEVEARSIEVNWNSEEGTIQEGMSTDWTMVYTSETYQPNDLFSASITNLAKKNVSDMPAAPTFTITSNPLTIKDARIYSFTLAITGTDENSNNYVVSETEKSVSTTLEITPVTLSLEGTIKAANFEYGTIPSLTGNTWWRYKSGSAQICDKDASVEILTYEIKNPAENGKYSVGSYSFNLKIVDGITNYVLSEDTTDGSIEIIAREIQLILDSSDNKTTSVYQKALVQLGAPYTVNHGTNVNTKDWLVYGDDLNSIFTLALIKNDIDVTLDEYNPVGIYDIKVIKGKDKNYNITVIDSQLIYENDSAKLGEYTITEAELTIDSILGNVDRNISISYDANPYAWLKSSEDQERPSLISYSGLKGINLEENKVIWTITKKNSTETVSGDTTQAFAKATYVVVASAPNHIVTEEVEVVVEIEKAVLSISVDFVGENALYYGEALPSLNSDLTASIYSVDGLKGEDDRNVIQGSFSYTSVDYVVWNEIGEYTTSFDVSRLSADNYSFVAKEGSLKVKELPIEISIPNLSNVYIQDVSKKEESDTLIVEAFIELYEKLNVTIDSSVNGRVTRYLKEGKNIYDIVTLMTNALLVDVVGNVIATNDVASYAFYLVSAADEDNLFKNYNITIYTEENTLDAPENALDGKTAVFVITAAVNEFTSVFGFEGVDSLTNSLDTVVTAWVYGVNALDGYDAVKHKISLPTTKFTSIPGEVTTNLDITYSLYCLDSVNSSWILLENETTDIRGLFTLVLSSGKFIASTYKIEYKLQGNENYTDAIDTRYFKVDPRDLYIWAKDTATYYGEDFGRSVETIGLVDNGCGVVDLLEEVLSVTYDYDYIAGTSNADSYTYTTKLYSENDKYSNYILHWNTTSVGEDKKGSLSVLPRPIVIQIDDKTSKYDFNKASDIHDDQGEVLTFTASLGDNILGISFANQNPFIGIKGTSFENDTQNIIKLYTNALLTGEVETQNVGKYAIFAAYTDALVKQNYSVTVQTVYERDLNLENIVNDYFTTEEAQYTFYETFIEEYFNTLSQENEMISSLGDIILSGTYSIITANLKLTLTAPNTAYDGMGKEVEIEGYGQNDPYGQISYKAQYDYGNDNYLDAAPINVGSYPVRIVVENPNYSFDAGSQGTRVRITERELDWTADINENGNYAKSNSYGTDRTIYLGVNHRNKLELKFASSIYTNTGVVLGDGKDARLTFDIAVHGKALDQTTMSLAEAYSSNFVSYNYDVDSALYELTAQHAGVYSVTLILSGTEAKNYKFPTAYLKPSTTDTYEFTFTIQRAVKTATRAKDTVIQYGTPVTLDGSTSNPQLFGGFTLDTTTLNLITAENAQLLGSADASKVTYSVPNYDSKITGATERCYILPSGLVLYNYDIQYSSLGVMTVQQREIVVVVRGAETKNSFASTIYTGELQGPNLTTNESSWAYFAPKDLDGGIKWYGDAVQDKNENFATLFNVSLDLYGDGSFGVNSGKGVNANTYYLNIHRGNIPTNYDVTFQNAKGQLLYEYPDTDLDTAPQFEITKKKLIVQAGSTGLNNTESFVTNFTIPYGNLLEKTESTYYYLTSQFEGLIEKDDTEFFLQTTNARMTYTTTKVAGNGEISYTPWDSHAGAIYTVSPNEIEFDNYQVTNWKTARMEVVSRLVTATTEDRTYTEHIDNGNINYHMGVEGTYHAAQVVFRDYDTSLYNTSGFDIYYKDGYIEKDQYGVILPNIITKYAPKYTTNYINLDDMTESIQPDGPRKAGAYTVTLAMVSDGVNYDYKIVTDSKPEVQTKLAYTVHKKKLSILWNSVSPDYLNYNTGDDKYRDIQNYINDIMNVTMINRQYTSSTSEQVIEHLSEALSSSSLSDGRYYINTRENKVTLKIYGVGLYTATISIANSAIRNYEWRDESGASGAEFTLAFRVAASSVIIDRLEFEKGSWIYGELAPEISFDTNVQGVGLLYKYARIDGIPNEFASPVFGEMISDKKLIEYLNDTEHNYGYSQTMPTNAGMYVMCAWYPGSDQYQMSEAFLVFEITKAPIKSPDLINSEFDFIEEDGKKIIEMVYTGNTLYLELDYDTKLLDISYSGSMSAPTAGKGMILHATDVLDGGYSISFRLSDDSNYAWDAASVGEYVWRILPAKDNEIMSFNTEELVAGLTYGDSYMDPYAISKYGDSIKIEYCIDGVWGLVRPTQAGTYKVRAISPATKNYYAGSVDTDAISDEVSFTIEKAELYVLASGSMMYGDNFNIIGGRGYSYQFAGFLNNDTSSLVTVGDIQYMLVDQPDRLEVGTYGIQLLEEDGEVYGMSADNYKILATEGNFTVQKKPVTVVLGDAQSVYGEKIDLSKVNVIVLNSELVAGDTLDDLNIELSIDSNRVDMESEFNPATAYKVNAEGYTSSKNYNVTVIGSGVYTIMPLNIYITVEAGGGVYQGQINPVQLTGIFAVDDNRNILEEFAPEVAPKIRFNYWGRSNDGNWSHTNADMWPSEPMLAGNYFATAVATQTNNYMLVTNMGTPSVSFVVERKTLDDTNREIIFANPIEYTGNSITPVVTDYSFEGLYHTKQVSFENVGLYSVPLTLKDSHNYRWASVDGDTCEIPFEVIRGYNAFESEVSITDWVYGAYDAVKNLPTATTKFGSAKDFTFSYSSSFDGDYTSNIPTQAGTYWVKITISQADNYYAVTSEAKEFHINKATISAPSLVIVAEGEGQNTTYTGSRLQAVISGYDPTTMRMIYEGDSSVGNIVAIFGLDAKIYTVSFALNDTTNYAWDSSTTVEEGNAVLQWKVGRKQLAKPTMNTSMFMVNGGTLTFIPVGFDEETMTIEGNKTSYGGSFKVTVTIKDTQNYEWADGTMDEVVFDWFVVGWDTVFIIVVSVIGIIAAIAGIAIIIQYALHKRKKKKELEDELAVQGLIVDEVSPVGEPTEKSSTKEKTSEEGGRNNE